MASSAISRKARKQHFSASEIAVLMERVEGNLSLIQSKFTNSVTNQKKNEMWKKIADAVNAVGVANYADNSRSSREVAKLAVAGKERIQ